MNTNLHERSMLVKVIITMWNNELVDTTATTRVHEDFACEGKAGTFTKRLVNPDALRPVISAKGAIRRFLNNHTLPWEDGGWRLLPSSGFFKFVEELGGLRDDFDRAVNHFITHWDTHKNAARLARKGLFREEDYPDPNTVAARFGVHVEFQPLPNANDFRMEVSNDVLTNIRQEMAATINARMKASAEHALTEVHQRLLHLYASLKSETVLREATITTPLGVVETTRALLQTLFPDARVANGLLERVYTTVTLLQAKLPALREDREERDLRATQVFDLMKELGDLLPNAELEDQPEQLQKAA